MADVMGLDLSLTATGYAFVEEGVLTGGGVLKSKAAPGTSATARRIRMLEMDVLDLVGDFSPFLVVIESPSFGSTTGAQHERAGLWWSVVCELDAFGYPIATVTPSGLKKYATGNGNSAKDEVLAAVIRRYPTQGWSITDNNVADACVLAAMGARHLAEPVEESMPDRALDAMKPVKWPEVNVC